MVEQKYLGAFGTTMAQMSRSWKNHRNPCTCIIQSLDDYDDDDDEKKYDDNDDDNL